MTDGQARPTRAQRTNTILAEIGHERARQVSDEGYSESHDDEHVQGEIAQQAAAYALMSGATKSQRDAQDVPKWAPWQMKLTTPRRELIKAAALLVAEIERLDRLAERKS